MRATFLFGAIALAGTAAAGATLVQSIEPAGEPVCPATTDKPDPDAGPAARQGPRSTATVKNGGKATTRPGNTKWGNIVLKRGAATTPADCPKGE